MYFYKKNYHNRILSYTYIPVILSKKKSAVVGDSYILIQNNAMIDIFLEWLKEVYNNSKKSNIEFKLEAWLEFQAGVQNIILVMSISW